MDNARLEKQIGEGQQTVQDQSIPCQTKADKLFDNLVTVEGLLQLLKRWLKKEHRRDTVYRWVMQGMPKEKIRGKLHFDPDEVALWLKRAK